MAEELLDLHCNIKGTVYNNSGLSYSATLNQVDISKNSNKFYIIQIIKASDGYYLWTRYGRVGEKGRTSSKRYQNEYSAIAEFNRVYGSKTGSPWGQACVPKKGKYHKMNLETPVLKVQPSKPDGQISTLPERTIKILQLISNRDLINVQLHRLKIDSQKLPLGKISTSQIDEAESILKYISDLLYYVSESGATDLGGMSIDDIISKASSGFWTLIPYASNRRESPPLINKIEQIDNLSSLLTDLRQLQVGVEIIENTDTIDSLYLSLGLEIKPLDKVSNEWSVLERYIKNSHAPTHHYDLDIIDILELDSSKQATIPLENRLLLFHGSRVSNFISILSTGLRIPLPTQVSNGSVLGKGIYFANSISKSFNYCDAEGLSEGGLVLICEVALGYSEVVTAPTYDRPLGSNYQSRMALGMAGPDEQMYDLSGVKIPLSPLKQRGVRSTFRYDEFVIYEANRYKFRYLVNLRSKPKY